jgi:hypothetical protein
MAILSVTRVPMTWRRNLNMNRLLKKISPAVAAPFIYLGLYILCREYNHFRTGNSELDMFDLGFIIVISFGILAEWGKK